MLLLIQIKGKPIRPRLSRGEPTPPRTDGPCKTLHYSQAEGGRAGREAGSRSNLRCLRHRSMSLSEFGSLAWLSVWQLASPTLALLPLSSQTCFFVPKGFTWTLSLPGSQSSTHSFPKYLGAPTLSQPGRERKTKTLSSRGLHSCGNLF